MQRRTLMRAAPLLALAPAWSAAQPHDAHAGHGAAGSAPTEAPQTEGEVRRIDRAQRRITLRHAPMPHLGMGAMTMVFGVADPALLEQAKEGDKVRFQAQRLAGVLTVLSLEPAAP